MHPRAHATSRPVLRLVGIDSSAAASSPPHDRHPAPDRRSDDESRRRIGRENHAAALRFDLDPNDPRWILAVRTQSELQGAALPADRRQRLLALAHQLGMRPFDANLVIAIVQDEARSGAAAGQLADRLRVVPERWPQTADRCEAAGTASQPRERGIPAIITMILSLAVGAAGLLWLIRWLDVG